MEFDYEESRTKTVKERFIHRILLAEISLVSMALAINSAVPYPIGVLVAISMLSLGNYLLINDMEKVRSMYQIETERRRILNERSKL